MESEGTVTPGEDNGYSKTHKIRAKPPNSLPPLPSCCLHGSPGSHFPA